MRRSQYPAHPDFSWPSGPGHGCCAICPVSSAVSRYLNFSIITSDPDHTGLNWRFRDRSNGAKSNRTSSLLPTFVIGSQIRAYLLPVVASVKRSEQTLSTNINYCSIMGRKMDRRCPVESVRFLSCLPGRLDIFSKPGFLIEPAKAPKLRVIINPAAISRVNNIIHTITAANCYPISQVDCP